MDGKSFFDNLSPKQGYWLGLVSGLLVLSTIGFIVLLVLFLGKGPSEPKTVAVNPPTNQPAQPPTTPAKVEFDISKANHIRGDYEAPVTLVEFSDFQCPFCSRFEPTVDQLLKDYQGKVRLVYKHFPLDSIHPNARPAAIASECAAEQKEEAFWSFHDAFFTKQDQLGPALYEQLTKDNGLNLTKFKSCLTDSKIAAKVEADFQEGSGKGVRGTPTTFVNGQAVSGAVPYEQFKSIVDALLTQS